MKRVKFKGMLNVFRESSQVEHLSATVALDDVHTFYYYRCPKVFDDLVTDGQDNYKKVSFTANEDGSNPRSAKLVG